MIIIIMHCPQMFSILLGKNVDEPETRSNPNPADATNSQEAPVVDVGEQSQQFHTIPSIFVLQSLGERIRDAEQQIRANKLQIAVINRLLLATAEIISKLEAESARRNISTVSADVGFQFSSVIFRCLSQFQDALYFAGLVSVFSDQKLIIYVWKKNN